MFLVPLQYNSSTAISLDGNCMCCVDKVQSIFITKYSVILLFVISHSDFYRLSLCSMLVPLPVTDTG